MTRHFLTSFLLISLLSFRQSDANLKTNPATGEDSSEYVKRAIDFIKQVEGQQLTNKNFILADKIFSIEYHDCLNQILTDTATFSKDELDSIKSKKYVFISNWTQDIFPNIKVISSDTIKSIFRDHTKGWPFFNENFGYSFSRFSFPIFLRNDMYCLFYSDYNCGGLCGRGRLILYKKEKDQWVEIKDYCHWVS